MATHGVTSGRPCPCFRPCYIGVSFLLLAFIHSVQCSLAWPGAAVSPRMRGGMHGPCLQRAHSLRRKLHSPCVPLCVGISTFVLHNHPISKLSISPFYSKGKWILERLSHIHGQQAAEPHLDLRFWTWSLWPPHSSILTHLRWLRRQIKKGRVRKLDSKTEVLVNLETALSLLSISRGNRG